VMETYSADHMKLEVSDAAREQLSMLIYLPRYIVEVLRIGGSCYVIITITKHKYKTVRFNNFHRSNS
jgi:hypothetical protein